MKSKEVTPRLVARTDMRALVRVRVRVRVEAQRHLG